jgi:acetyltransferase-like isoleucine patch superfamily enzyme
VYIDGTLIPEGAHVNIIKSDYVYMDFPYRFIKEGDDGKIMDGKLMKNVGVDYDPEGRGAIVTYKVHLDTGVDIVFKSNEYYFVVTHKPVLIKNPPMRGSGRRKRSRKTKRRQSKRRSRK